MAQKKSTTKSTTVSVKPAASAASTKKAKEKQNDTELASPTMPMKKLVAGGTSVSVEECAIRQSARQVPITTKSANIRPRISSMGANTSMPRDNTVSKKPATTAAKGSSTTKSTTALKNPTTAVKASLTTSKQSTTASKKAPVAAHSEIPQQVLDEMVALKAQLARSEAMVDKYKKNALVLPVEKKQEVPEPKGYYNLQRAMGLEDQKQVYNDCRAAVATIMAKVGIPISVDWRRQDSANVAKVFSLVKDLEPRLAGFERNWAIAAIMRSMNKNKRGYRSKRVRKPPPRQQEESITTTGTDVGRDGSEGEEVNENNEDKEDDEYDEHDHDYGNSNAAELDDDNNNTDAEFKEQEEAGGLIDLDEATSNSDMEAAGSGDEMASVEEESGGTEDEGEGIDEEKQKQGRRLLKRRLPVDKSEEEVSAKLRKKRGS